LPKPESFLGPWRSTEVHAGEPLVHTVAWAKKPVQLQPKLAMSRPKIVTIDMHKRNAAQAWQGGDHALPAIFF